MKTGLYNDFARKIIEKDSKYRKIVKYIHINLSKLIPENVISEIESIAEVGGACGHVLNYYKIFFEKRGNNIKKVVNFEISREFIDYGKRLYKFIEFYEGDFMNNWNKKGKFDLIILSDIIEHIEEDDVFLEKVSKISKYVFVYIPCEDNLLNTILEFIKKREKIGMNHPSGHLRKYNIAKCEKLLSKHFYILNSKIFIHPIYLTKTPWGIKIKRSMLGIILVIFMKILNKLLPKKIYVRLFGGNYMAFLKSKNW